MAMLPALPSNEISFLARMLAKDAKNYHVWAYRQWMVRHFSLWPSPEDPGSELPFVESLLFSDVRNNSAWNHRYFLLFGRDPAVPVSAEVVSKEIEFTKAKIELAPQNAAAWNYLRGVSRGQEDEVQNLETFAMKYVNMERPEETRSSHALDLLAETWAKRHRKSEAAQALDLLADRFDPIRKNYWNYRKGLLEIDATT